MDNEIIERCGAGKPAAETEYAWLQSYIVGLGVRYPLLKAENVEVRVLDNPRCPAFATASRIYVSSYLLQELLGEGKREDTLATLFVVSHELGHVWGGHPAQFQRLQRFTDKSGEDRLLILYTRELELEADGRGAVLMLMAGYGISDVEVAYKRAFKVLKDLYGDAFSADATHPSYLEREIALDNRLTHLKMLSLEFRRVSHEGNPRLVIKRLSKMRRLLMSDSLLFAYRDPYVSMNLGTAYLSLAFMHCGDDEFRDVLFWAIYPAYQGERSEEGGSRRECLQYVDSAIFYLNEALSFTRRSSRRDTYAIYNNIGVAYRLKGVMFRDRARYYFDTAYRFLSVARRSAKDGFNRSKITFNMGGLAFYAEKYGVKVAGLRPASYYFRRVLESSSGVGTIEVSFYLGIYYQKVRKKRDSARYYLSIAAGGEGDIASKASEALSKYGSFYPKRPPVAVEDSLPYLGILGRSIEEVSAEYGCSPLQGNLYMCSPKGGATTLVLKVSPSGVVESMKLVGKVKTKRGIYVGMKREKLARLLTLPPSYTAQNQQEVYYPVVWKSGYRVKIFINNDRVSGLEVALM